jgi:hypothetical protein
MACGSPTPITAIVVVTEGWGSLAGSDGKGGDNPAVAEARVTAAKLDAFRKGIA